MALDDQLLASRGQIPEWTPSSSHQSTVGETSGPLDIEIVGSANPAFKPMLAKTLDDGAQVLKQLPPKDIELAFRLVELVTGGPVKVVMGEAVNRIVQSTVGEELEEVRQAVTEETAEFLNDKPDGWYGITAEDRISQGASEELATSYEADSARSLEGAELGVQILGATTGVTVGRVISKVNGPDLENRSDNKNLGGDQNYESGKQPWKYENRAEITKRNAAEINAEHALRGNRPPYKNGTQVIEYTTKKDDIFVRVHGDDNAARPWMMRKEAIEGLSADQIQRKYSLPSRPKYVSDVHVPAGTRIRTGKVETNFEIQGGGGQGATQYEWLKTRMPPEAISNTRKLD